MMVVNTFEGNMFIFDWHDCLVEICMNGAKSPTIRNFILLQHLCLTYFLYEGLVVIIFEWPFFLIY